MNQTLVLKDSWDVDSKLETLDITKKELVSIAISAATAKNDAVSIDPINAPGQLSYIYGTRAIRMALLPKKGWRLDRHDNIETTFNQELNVRIIFQNVDFACSEHSPKAISSKGNATKRLVENNAAFLWPEMEDDFKARENTSVWFFCVSTKGDEVRAELSRPCLIEDGQFCGFVERIYIIADNDWNPVEDVDTNDQDFDIQVTRK